MTLFDFIKMTDAFNSDNTDGYNILICPDYNEWSWAIINTDSPIMELIMDKFTIDSIDKVDEDEREKDIDFKVWVSRKDK